MKFSAAADAFRAALRDVSSVLAARAAHPVYSLVLVEADDPRSVTLTATDGEQRLEVGFAAEVSGFGACCLNAQALVNNCAVLRDSVLVNVNGNDLELDDGHGQTGLRLDHLTREKYPPRGDDVKPSCSFRVDGKVLGRLLAIAQDGLPVGEVQAGKINGVSFDLLGGDLGLLASDNVLRMIFAQADVQDPLFAGEATRHVATVPPRAVQTAIGLLRGAGEVVVIFHDRGGQIDGDQFAFRFPITFYQKQTAWRQGRDNAPREGPGATVEASDFLRAAQRAYACVRDDEETKAIALSVSAERGLLASARGQAGEAGAGCPVVELHGEAAARVNGKVLVEHLRAIGPGPVRLVITPSVVTLGRPKLLIAVARMGGSP